MTDPCLQAEVVAANVSLALARMRLDKLPLLQFHTWDYLDGPGTVLPST